MSAPVVVVVVCGDKCGNRRVGDVRRHATFFEFTPRVARLDLPVGTSQWWKYRRMRLTPPDPPNAFFEIYCQKCGWLQTSTDELVAAARQAGPKTSRVRAVRGPRPTSLAADGVLDR